MTLNYKNTSLYYETHGDGEAIVLLHGFLESSVMWHRLISELKLSHQVICIDLLGHGQTGCLGYIHTMEDMAEAVQFVLQYLKIDQAIVIGHSMGGYVALAMAQQHPKIFKGLCLMNSTFEDDSEERKRLRQRAINMAKDQYETLVRLSFANLFAPNSRLTFKYDYEKALENALLTPIQGFIAGHAGMLKRPDRFETFKNLTCNKLIIIGAKDSLMDTNVILKKIKSTDIDHIILSEGHMSHIENYYELSYNILRFIEK